MTTPKLEDVLKFPCEFQIKIMGENVPELIQEVTKVILEHDVLFNPELQITLKPSSKGNYVSVNAMVNAVSRAQLDAIYTALNRHELVKITL
jgi:putative lipoic acid-binding regulatory protein